MNNFINLNLKPNVFWHEKRIKFGLYSFSSVRIIFKEEVTFEGIPAYRYQIGDDFLYDIGPEYGNECFCLGRIENIPSHSNGCLYRGAMDLSTCQGNFDVFFVYYFFVKSVKLFSM